MCSRNVTQVHIIKAVYEFGVNVIHSDTDVVWFGDPLPFFHERLSGPVHVIMATDAVATGNPVGDMGLEVTTNPFTNINTGPRGRAGADRRGQASFLADIRSLCTFPANSCARVTRAPGVRVAPMTMDTGC